MSEIVEITIESGASIEAPLNTLKASPRNARRTPHTQAAVEALAGSIAAKGVLQPLVVEPELNGQGERTGFWLVTIGEGRRLALRLLAKRKRIKKTHLVRCVVDLTNDPHEISLDENVTRFAMHPADEFAAFARLGDEMGLDAEQIAVRFGVTAHHVRQRLRLGSASPRLMQAYRDGELTLERLMAFCVSGDHARQEQVFEALGSARTPQAIRQYMTETKVHADDRRARLIGAEAYQAAGGAILRDLFTEDDGGWFEDVALLDRLVAEVLDAKAREVRAFEGWKWAEAHLNFPYGHGLGRVFPSQVQPTDAELAEASELAEEYDALLTTWDTADEVPPEVETRFAQIDAALRLVGERQAYDPDAVQRAGVFVVLDQSGSLRIERGYVRPEDEPVTENEGEPENAGEAEVQHQPDTIEEDEAEKLSEPERRELPDRLIAELTAYRTLGLRDALAARPDAALIALVHALALRAFFPYGGGVYSCLAIKAAAAELHPHAPQALESVGGRRIAERHERWGTRLPSEPEAMWAAICALDDGDLMNLMAHCVSLSVWAVRSPLDKQNEQRAHADVLAPFVGLDMKEYWTHSEAGFLGRLTKAEIIDAVREGVSEAEAAKLVGAKKDVMVDLADAVMTGSGWLPCWLRTPVKDQEPADELDAAA